MGQKVNPIGLRLGINRTWNSRWYADHDYMDLLHEDIKIREQVILSIGQIQKQAKLDSLKPEAKNFKNLSTQIKSSRIDVVDVGRQAAISRIAIERSAKRPRVTIYTARPGIIIGKKGTDIDKLRKRLSFVTGSEVGLNIVEIRKPDVDATLVAEGVAQQLERRVSFRRALKRAVQNSMRGGALGIRINAAGRLGGAEIARTEWYREGRVPLHTLRCDIDYGVASARTTYGIVGIKVWIYKGEILEHDPMAHDRRIVEAQAGGASGGRDR